jgi:MoaA/NifB/PqqE/SkfB family radical SAM enzyme
MTDSLTAMGPRKVYVEPTTACNLSCRTCVRNAWDEPHGFMEWGTFEALVESLSEVQGQATVALMGLGEPLLHPRLLDMVRLAKGRGLRVELTTNGLLLDDEMARGLRKAALDQLVVSIDGASAETFGKVRSGAPLEQVIDNLRRLQDRRGTYYGPKIRIGIEFVAMRSNLTELAGLNRLAAQIGASFLIITNVLPYTADLVDEALYAFGLPLGGAPGNVAAPRWQLANFVWDEEVGAALGRALRRAGPTSFSDTMSEASVDRCPFVLADACAVAWHGGVSPCPPLLHSYPCFILGREKRMTRWEVGRLPEEDLQRVWRKVVYEEFRQRVRLFDFPACARCGGCEMAEGNLEDCFGNPHPVCGDCLWAAGIIRCP